MGSLIYPLSPDGEEGQGEGEDNLLYAPINNQRPSRGRLE
jgi:hypothetical protein